jgi:predicted nucleotidyltransferase
MHALIILDQMVSFARTHPEVKGLALIGSHARGDAGPWSDVDLVFHVARREAIMDVFDSCVSFMSTIIKHVIRPESNKWVILTTENCLRIDMTAVFEVSDIEMIYRGSRIKNPKNTVLVDKEGMLKKTFEKSRDNEDSDLPILVSNEVEKFIESFEASSRYAQQGDVFRFYFNYNLSLTRYGRLVQLAQDNDAFLYTPRRLLENMSPSQRRAAERLCAPLVLSEARPVLNGLKAEFSSIYSKLRFKHSMLTRSTEEIITILQDILNRDLVWNLRDISWISPDVLYEGRLFRSSTLSRFEHERAYDTLLDRLGIQRIIDLRYDHERARYPYSYHTSRKVKIVQLTMGMESASMKVFGHSTGIIHVDMIDNSLVFKKFFSLLAEGIPTLVHCHSGKDRTGVLIALLYLAIGIPIDFAYRDFLASGMDLTDKDADRFFGRIKELGDINEILNSLGVNPRNVHSICKWLLK